MSTYRSVSVTVARGFVPADPGAAPILQWIEIADLLVDDRYQRNLQAGNWAAIKRIAQQFRWSRFSPVFVASVEGGKFAIIDGQHRCHAALMCGHEKVPCQIVPMDLREQAEAFAAVNGLVTKVTTWQLFKASLAAGEAWAMRISEIAEKGDCKVMSQNASHWVKKPGEIYGVKTFRAACTGRDDAHLSAALKFLRGCEGWKSDASYWDSGLFIPVLIALYERPRVLARPGFQSAFEEFDIFGWIDRDKQERRERIRKGLPYAPRSETLRAAMLEWIDKSFPERMAVPQSRKDVMALIAQVKP